MFFDIVSSGRVEIRENQEPYKTFAFFLVSLHCVHFIALALSIAHKRP